MQADGLFPRFLNSREPYRQLFLCCCILFVADWRATTDKKSSWSDLYTPAKLPAPLSRVHQGRTQDKTPAHHTLGEKKQQKNGVKQAWDIIRDFELLQFFMRACALNDPGRIKNWNQKILVSVWLCVQVQQRFLNMRRASNPCDHTSAGSPSDFSQMTTKRIEVFENNSWRLMCSSRIGTSQGWKHFNHTHKTGYLYLVGVLFKISDDHLPPRGTRLQQQQQQRDQGRVFRKPVKPRVKR